MTAATFPNDELRALADIACDGALAEQDFAQLEQLLIGNAEAQQYYLKHVCLDRWLRWEFSRESPEQMLPQPAPTLDFFPSPSKARSAMSPQVGWRRICWQR